MAGKKHRSHKEETKHKLSKTLFTDSGISIYQVFLDEDWHDDENFDDWNLEPINAPILSAEYTREKLLDGEFILKAELLSAPGQSEPCYLGITMPEGIVGCTYILDLESEQIIRKRGRHWDGKTVVPLVAIEKLVDYRICYSKIDPEVGLRVLRQGLEVAKSRWPIADALARILGDEHRYAEAVEAITIVINEGPSYLQSSNYKERAWLLERLGDAEGAERDRKLAEQILKSANPTGKKPG